MITKSICRLAPQFAGRALALCLVAISFAAHASGEMMLQDFDAKKHYRFYDGVDKAFIGADYNSSGVGLSTPSGIEATSSQWLTMISPTFGITAHHFSPSTGENIDFYHTNAIGSPSESRTVANSWQIGTSDLMLVKLSSAVSGSVHKYSILDLPSDSDYNNREIFTFGKNTDNTSTQNQRLGRNHIDPGSIASRSVGGGPEGMTYLFDYDDPGGAGDDESHVVGGDSGGPSFAIADGEFALVGIHWFLTLDE